MAVKNLFDLICGALPVGIDRETLKSCAPDAIWQSNQIAACGIALSKCEYLDWDAYLANNPDVDSNKITPIIHFIRYGVFEGRKLYIKKYGYKKEFASNNKISIIIPNHNKGWLIEKCLQSVLEQAYDDLEIIVVDDMSDDNSKAYLRELANKDTRVILLELNKNSGPHLARKTGVEASSGKYIMFLDSDDFLVPTACEVAIRQIKHGYDIVSFNFNIIFPESYIPAVKSRIANILNCGVPGEYRGVNLIKAFFEDSRTSLSLAGKIFNAQIVKQAYSELNDGSFFNGDIYYALLVLAYNAHTHLKIADRLYNYRYGIGISTRGDEVQHSNLALTLGNIMPAIKCFLDTKGLQHYNAYFTRKLLSQSVDYWLEKAPKEQASVFFTNMVDQYGIMQVLTYLIDKHYEEWDKIAGNIQDYGLRSRSYNRKNIGMLYRGMRNGGAENVVKELTCMLLDNSYNVTIFLEEANENDSKLDPRVKIIYVAPYDKGKSGLKEHLLQMRNILQSEKIDLMISHDCWTDGLLYQIILLKSIGIPLILVHHSDFYHPLIYPHRAYNLQMCAAVYKNLDQLICLSLESEIYFRKCGINARYIHNPIHKAILPPLPFEKRRSNLIFIGRLSEPIKQSIECLYVLAEIIKILPSIRLTFIGSFSSDTSRDKFYARAQGLGVIDNIYVTGWTHTPDIFIDNAALMLSTAYTEGFSLAMGEAQAKGLPCIMYYIPTMYIKNNESVICVPQGDRKEMAQQITNLLQDSARWHRLSAIACENTLKFSPESYLVDMLDVVNNFDKFSYVTKYSKEEYNTIIKALAYYGAHLPPWEEYPDRKI